jgi:transcriptional regulator with XRE-family HTH domain
MTYRDETAGSDDPQSLLQQLRTSLLAEAEAEAEDPTTDDAQLDRDERWLRQQLGSEQLPVPSVVGAAADNVIPPVTPSPEMRTRAIEAASRALAKRRDANGLLPVLLRTARQHADLAVTDVAAAAGLSPAVVGKLETGETPVDKVEAETVAAWIGAVPAERNAAVAALTRSLRACWTGDQPLLAASSDERPTDVDAFVAIVQRILDINRERS